MRSFQNTPLHDTYFLLYNILNTCEEKASKRVRKALLIGLFTQKSPIPSLASVQYWLFRLILLPGEIRTVVPTHTGIGCETFSKVEVMFCPIKLHRFWLRKTLLVVRSSSFFYFCLSPLQRFPFLPLLLFPQYWWYKEEEKRISTLVRSGNKIVFQNFYLLLKDNYDFAFVNALFTTAKRLKSKRKVWSLTHLSVMNREVTEGFYSGFLFCFFLLSCLPFITRRSGLPLRWKAR